VPFQLFGLNVQLALAHRVREDYLLIFGRRSWNGTRFPAWAGWLASSLDQSPGPDLQREHAISSVAGCSWAGEFAISSLLLRTQPNRSESMYILRQVRKVQPFLFGFTACELVLPSFPGDDNFHRK